MTREGRRPAEDTLLGSPAVRMLMGFAAALGLLVVVTNVPIWDNPAGISWRGIHRSEPIQFVQQPREIVEKHEIEGGVITRFSSVPEDDSEDAGEGDEPEEDRGQDIPEPKNRIAKIERIDRGPILEFVDQTPTVVGGMGTLYLNIDYPKVARDNGIQGLTVLVFVVEKDGTTSDIQVLKSLHPACDSAAVEAVRRTRFKPGRQNGRIVRVKMRLPIRFKLINPVGADTLTYPSESS